MNCLIVDDQSVFRVILKKMISLDPSLVLIKECSSANEAYKEISENNIDLLFLDVEMPGLSGIELVKLLEGRRPLIIFITSKLEYAIDAFDLNIVDFLIKPIETARFLKAVGRAKEQHKLKLQNLTDQSNNFVFIRDSNIVRKIDIKDILYLEARNNYIHIYTNTISYSLLSSLKSIEEKLPSELFVRVHRSFIINLSKIESIEGTTLFINKTVVPISDSYRAVLNKSMKFL